MAHQLISFSLKQVELLPSEFRRRFELNYRYLCSLKSENLLQSHYLEAGLWGPRFGKAQSRTHKAWQLPGDIHWGWESPSSQVRGHFVGHWLSAVSRIVASTGDVELKARADGIVSEIARCQRENGGQWAGPIPEKYLHWIARGKRVWAPQYILHKSLMGLLDMHLHGGNDEALSIVEQWAKWFRRWTAQFSREQFDDILDFETGGMMEAWADLYAITGRQEHLDLMLAYERRRLFDRLLAGEDALTNRHANTTIPEAHGAARAYEITGEKRFRDIAEAYWKCAVTDRGCFCTGGQTSAELWTPPHQHAAQLVHQTQEHCGTYNMMRLAEYLLRWTGEPQYADYWERNLYNGILAQQHPQTGMVAYYLPLEPGAVKRWGTPTDSFWCCHGTLVQAHTHHNSAVYYEDADGLVVSQYIPTRLTATRSGTPITVTQSVDPQVCDGVKVYDGDGPESGPRQDVILLHVNCDRPLAFTLKLRVPWWVADTPTVQINGDRVAADAGPTSFQAIKRKWHHDTVRITLAKKLWTHPLPDRPETVAFMEGPIVLAGLTDTQPTLTGVIDSPDSLLIPDDQRNYTDWQPHYLTVDQPQNIRFVPLYEIADERYTVYFPVRDPG